MSEIVKVIDIFDAIASAVHVQGELTLSLADNTTPGFSAVFSFRKSRV